MRELERAAIEAAREVRELLAEQIAARSDQPDLSRLLGSAVGDLFSAEVQVGSALLDKLEAAMARLRGALDHDAWAADEPLARALSRSLALLHPTKSELARALGRVRRDDSTAPFLLASARIRQGSLPANTERRGADRALIEVHVGLEGETRFYTGTTGDISRGGLFVATHEPLPVGTELILSFVLPDGYRVRVRAEVAWVRAPRYRPHELPEGMGVRFAELDEDDVTAIHHFLEERPAFHYGD